MWLVSNLLTQGSKKRKEIAKMLIMCKQIDCHGFM